MGLKLIPDETNIKFTKFSPGAFVLSAIAVIASIAAFFMIGLNFGIDFKGGGVVEIAPVEATSFNETERSAMASAMAALNLGEVTVTEISAKGGETTNVVITFEQQPAEKTFSAACQAATPDGLTGEPQDKNQQIATACVQATIKQLMGDKSTVARVETVSGTVSGELVQAGTRAVVIAIVFMLIYIWWRFEWQFSLGAILALIHDVILTIGMFAVTQIEFNLPIIAALLTIVGYSMNDTVVVYDRVRENLRKYKKKPLTEVLDLSINNTLSRTIMTSVTTLLALIALLVIGGSVLRGFTAAMIWGVIIGTYSSVFIASPVLRLTGVKRDWSKDAN